ncbi:MAG: type II toxin-antitoxin system RelE/ParE family toxin [Xenococcaceae cyanobacterium]
MKLRFRPQALADLEEIHDYIGEDNLAKAKEFVALLRERCTLIAKNPSIGVSRPEIREGVRSFSVKKYIIFYRILDDTVEVLAVVHGARDIRSIF